MGMPRQTGAGRAARKQAIAGRERRKKHSLTEIINQCATMERLIDALTWAKRKWPGCIVERCHPTTSSRKQQGHLDNDLVLRLRNGRRLRFEVSDVVSSLDGNDKEIKDLVSLGVFESRARPLAMSKSWPKDRLFLVVSEEFHTRLMRTTRHMLKTGKLRYSDVDSERKAHIIEVKRGSKRTP